MDNEYNYGNDDEKREEPVKIDPPVQDNTEAERTDSVDSQSEKEHTASNPVQGDGFQMYDSEEKDSQSFQRENSQTYSSQAYDSQTYDSQTYDSPTYGAPTYEQQQEQPQGEPYRKKKEKKPMHIGVKWATCICMALVFGLLASATFQAGNLVFDKALGDKKTTAAGQQVNSTKVSTNTSSDVDSELADMVESVMPSIVSITNLSVQQVQDFFGGVREYESQSSGSGIIIGENDSELLLVTNNHVVEGSSTLTVTFVDGESVEAQVKGTDANIDLAIVSVQLDKIESSTKEAIKKATLGDSDALRVGEPAIAIGNALGYGQSVTDGIVSAKEREVEGFETKLIQTDAAINPGNSGGALLNANGEVIGINTVKVNADAVEGMGYAIPISDVTEVMNDLMNRQTRTKVDEAQRGTLGIIGTDVNAQSAEVYNMPEGVFISEVVEDGAAEKAGLTKGSIITKFDGTKIDSMETLKAQLEYYKAGETVEVTVQMPEKNGEYKEETVELTLESASQER